MFSAKMYQTLSGGDTSPSPMTSAQTATSSSLTSSPPGASGPTVPLSLGSHPLLAQQSLQSHQHLFAAQQQLLMQMQYNTAQQHQHQHQHQSNNSTLNLNSYISLLYSLSEQRKQISEKIVQLNNAIRHHRHIMSDITSMQKVFIMEEQLSKEISELKRIEDYIALMHQMQPQPDPSQNNNNNKSISRADSMDILTSTLSKVTKIDSRASINHPNPNPNPNPISYSTPHPIQIPSENGTKIKSSSSSNSSSTTSSPPSSATHLSNSNPNPNPNPNSSTILNPLVRMKLRDHLLNKSQKANNNSSHAIHAIKSMPNGVQYKAKQSTSPPAALHHHKDRSPIQSKRLKSDHHHHHHHHASASTSAQASAPNATTSATNSTSAEIHCVQSEPSINARIQKRSIPSDDVISAQNQQHSTASSTNDVRNILSSFLTNKAANKSNKDINNNQSATAPSPSGPHAFKPLKKESSTRLSSLAEHPQFTQSPSHHLMGSMSLSALPMHGNADYMRAATRLRHHHPYNFYGSSLSASLGELFIPQFGGNATHANAENELLIADEIQQSESAHDLNEDESGAKNARIQKSCSASFLANKGMKRHAPQDFASCMDDLASRYYLAAATAMLLQQQQQQSQAQVSAAPKMFCMSEPYLRPIGGGVGDVARVSSGSARRVGGCTGVGFDERTMEHECVCDEAARVHIETPARLNAIWNRLKSVGLLDECEIFAAGDRAPLATIDDLLVCHDPAYVALFADDEVLSAAASAQLIRQAPCRGLALASDLDNPWNPKYTALACRAAVACCFEMASAIVTGKIRNGFAIVRPPGSHAEHNSSLGFCYLNNVAITAKLLKKNFNLDRILIVDWDVHHGNGTQQLTYDDPNILYISLHRYDNGEFFPGTGSINECGAGEAKGRNVNIAWDGRLEPPMGDVEYLAAFRTVVMPIAKSFKPQIVLVSCGFDATESHSRELGGYKITPTCFAYMTKKLQSVAEDGRILLVLEGGYELKSIADCSEACVQALLDKHVPSFPTNTLEALPNSQAVINLNQVVQIQKSYWPVVKDSAKYIEMSQSQFIRSIDTAE